jgi:hypothetical protein
MAEEALALPQVDTLGPTPAPPRKGLFGGFGGKPAPGPSPEVLGLVEQMNGLAARMRVSEERLNELRKKISFVEQNLLANYKKVLGDIKTSNDEIDELRHKLVDVEDRIITVIKELRMSARKTDLDVLRRYIELWDPVKFVTAEQAERIARDILSTPEQKEQNI